MADEPKVYSDTVTKTLTRGLVDILAEAHVQDVVAEYLASRNIVSVTAFADLADDRSGIVQVLARPAGLDPRDPLEVQPIRTAWRAAEAEAKVQLESKIKGETPEQESTLSQDQRNKIDRSAETYYHFIWPPALLANDQLMARLVRFYQKKTRYVPKLAQTRALNDKVVEATAVTIKIDKHKRSTPQAEEVEEDVQIQGLWMMIRLHMILMIAYNQAASPDFDTASLTELLAYHVWVQQKAMERDGQGSTPTIQSVVAADEEMRTLWMLSFKSGEFQTLTEAIKYHRNHSAYLFSGLHRTAGKGRPFSRRTPPPKRQKGDGKGDGKGGGKSPPKQRQSQAPGQRSPGNPPFKLEEKDAYGNLICKWYNKGNCNRGSACAYIHACNFPGCGKDHPRCENHETRP